MGLKRFGVSLDESLLESLDLFVVNLNSATLL